MIGGTQTSLFDNKCKLERPGVGAAETPRAKKKRSAALTAWMNLSEDIIIMILKRREQEKACRGVAQAARVEGPAFKYVKDGGSASGEYPREGRI
jgi:hypothetical protein